MRLRSFHECALGLLAAALLASCPSPGVPSGEDDEDDGSAFIGRSWWGYWNRLDESQRWRFSDRTVSVTSNPYTTYPTEWGPAIRRQTVEGAAGEYWVEGNIGSANSNDLFALELISPTVIEITDYSSSDVIFDKYFLAREGGFQEPFEGRVLENAGTAARSAAASRGVGARMLQPAAGISLMILNVLNASDVLPSAAVGDDGSFQSQSFLPGEEYRITVSGTEGSAFSVDVMPVDGGVDIGNVVAAGNGYHLKSGIDIPEGKAVATYTGSYTGDVTPAVGFLYPGVWYEGEIVIKKYGEAAGPALDWSILSPDGDVSIATSTSGKLLGVADYAESYPAIPIRLETDSSSQAEFEDRRLELGITDENGLSWDDRLSLRFYRDAILVELEVHKKTGYGGSQIQGAILSPEGQSVFFTLYKQEIRLPYREAGYTVGIVPHADYNVRFALGVDKVGSAGDAEVGSSSAIDQEHALDIAYGASILTTMGAGESRWFHLAP